MRQTRFHNNNLRSTFGYQTQISQKWGLKCALLASCCCVISFDLFPYFLLHELFPFHLNFNIFELVTKLFSCFLPQSLLSLNFNFVNSQFIYFFISSCLVSYITFHNYNHSMQIVLNHAAVHTTIIKYLLRRRKK